MFLATTGLLNSSWASAPSSLFALVASGILCQALNCSIFRWLYGDFRDDAAAIPQMMVRIDDLERWLQDFLFPLRPPRRIAVARCGRSAAGNSHGGCGAGLRLYRGRAKHGATKHSRRSDQHRASQYRMRANRLLSHRFSSEFFLVRASRSCS
jgi:hypothetical protein